MKHSTAFIFLVIVALQFIATTCYIVSPPITRSAPTEDELVALKKLYPERKELYERHEKNMERGFEKEAKVEVEFEKGEKWTKADIEKSEKNMEKKLQADPELGGKEKATKLYQYELEAKEDKAAFAKMLEANPMLEKREKAIEKFAMFIEKNFEGNSVPGIYNGELRRLRSVAAKSGE